AARQLLGRPGRLPIAACPYYTPCLHALVRFAVGASRALGESMRISTPTLEPSQFDQAARRTLERCNELARCSATPSQLTRLFGSPAMQAAHQKLLAWMESAGLECRIDPAANLIGRLAESRDAALAPSLLIGSHLDTVVNAGKFDGILGVL